MNLTTIGRWAFLLGLIISFIAGFGGEIPALMTVLFALGLIVGFLNISERESTHFLVAVIALLVIGLAGLQFGKFTLIIAAILQNIIAFVAAAGLIVAVKQTLAIAKKVE